MNDDLPRDARHRPGIDRLRRIVRSRMRRQATGLAHDYAHIERVWATSQTIALDELRRGAPAPDGDVLECAVLLHEVGRGAEQAGEDHAVASVRAAEELLRSEDLADLVWPVCETILVHLSRRTPDTSEARILHDADLLDDLGAIGVARALLDAATQAVPALFDPDDPLGRRRALDEASWVLDRFPARLFHLATGMQTAWGVAEAARRARTVKAFYLAVLRECGVDEVPETP